MTPLDDELRRTLADRATLVAPSADPMHGVEARAGRLRRRRTATAVLGAAAAVAAVALAVPTLTPDGGTTVVQGATTTTAASVSQSPSPAASAAPANLLTWEPRGKDAYSPSTLDLRARFVQALGGTDPDEAEYSPLFVDRVDGVSFTMGQAWLKGSRALAYSVSYAVGPDNVPQFFLGPATPKNPWGLTFVANGMQTYQLLVVVGRPDLGQVSYSAGASGAFRAAPFTDGVALVHRDLQASEDRLQVLDGNGDLDHPLYEGPVTPLLCDIHTCT